MTSTIVLIAGFYHHSRFFQLTLFPSAPNKEDVQFSIMSFNVLNFGKGNNKKGNNNGNKNAEDNK